MPIIDGFDEESIQTVSHFGIVAGAYESLGIGQVKDLEHADLIFAPCRDPRYSYSEHRVNHAGIDQK